MNHSASQLEIFQMLTAFGSAIDGCVINRYDWSTFTEDGFPTITQRIKPWFRYAGKPRAIHEAINPAGTTKFPYITYILNGVNHRPEVSTNKNSVFKDVKWSGTDGLDYTRKPTPISLSVTVHIGAKKKSDIESIITHFLAVCNPEFYVSWREPFTGHEIKSKVVWGGDANIDTPLDLPTTDDFTFKTELSFTIEGWIWRDYIDKLYPVKKLEINYGITDDCGCGNYYADAETDDYFDTLEFKSDVTIDRIYGECLNAGDYVYVDGNRIDQIEGVYLTNLSGDEIPTQSYEPFCWSESLSASCPKFDGYMIPEYDVIDDSTIRFIVPDELSAYDGEYDVRVTNRWTGCVNIDKEKRTKLNNISLVQGG